MQKDMQNSQNQEKILAAMQHTKANIYRQMGLAGLAVVVALVICFAMTVAWYSNIIHSDNMIFQASDWDFTFEGEVVLGSPNENGIVSASPGDGGVVELSIQNTSQETLGVQVSTVKGQLSEEMQKRIYFYVDTAQMQREEQVDRVYLSGQDGYMYKVLAGNTLSMSEAYCSHAPLKWEWVYDVLGYYMLGTVATGAEGTPIISVQEYVKPVIYDYDSAEFDAAGNLASVNGITASDYLANLYATDGYNGTQVGTPVNGYYPVEVDDSGYGVWLYLCSKAEIENANKWDYELGTQEEKQGFQVNLVLTGHKVQETMVSVADSTQLAAELLAGTDRVVLPADLALDEGLILQVAAGTDSILDLNGHTLSASGRDTMLVMGEGSSLTVINGNLQLEGTAEDKSRVVYMTGAELTLNGVTVTGPYEGIYIEDNVSIGPDSRVYITNSTIHTGDVCVYITGDGNVDTRKTTLVIHGSKLESSDYIGIMGNGSDNKAGTEIQIKKSSISGYWAGIYQPQLNSSMSIADSTVTGYTGIAVKAGDVLIDNSQIFGTGEGVDAAYAASGFTDTGNAVYIEDNYATPISVVIKGSNTVVKSTHRAALQVYMPGSTYASLAVSGGIYSSDVSGYLASGYTCTQKADGSFEVGPIGTGLTE